jgi:hypothetical protein
MKISSIPCDTVSSRTLNIFNIIWVVNCRGSDIIAKGMVVDGTCSSRDSIDVCSDIIRPIVTTSCGVPVIVFSIISGIVVSIVSNYIEVERVVISC